MIVWGALVSVIHNLNVGVVQGGFICRHTNAATLVFERRPRVGRSLVRSGTCSCAGVGRLLQECRGSCNACLRSKSCTIFAVARNSRQHAHRANILRPWAATATKPYMLGPARGVGAAETSHTVDFWFECSRCRWQYGISWPDRKHVAIERATMPPFQLATWSIRTRSKTAPQAPSLLQSSERVMVPTVICVVEYSSRIAVFDEQFSTPVCGYSQMCSHSSGPDSRHVDRAREERSATS